MYDDRVDMKTLLLGVGIFGRVTCRITLCPYIMASRKALWVVE